MHSLVWKKLCRGKAEGELGFRTIEAFNMALLAKQLCRLIDNPESLLRRFLRDAIFKKSIRLIKVNLTLPLLDGRVSYQLVIS